MLGVVILWGANVSVSKGTLPAFGAVSFAALRCMISSIVLCWLMLRRDGMPSLSRRAWFRIALVGLAGNTLYPFCFALGIERTTATNTGILMGLTPVVVTFGGAWLGWERLNRTLVGGIAVAVTGMVIVVGARSSSAVQGSLLGDLLAVAGCFCFAAYTLGLRWLRDDATGLQITALAMVVGTVPLVVISAPALLATSWAAVPWSAWVGLSYASVIAQCVGYIVWSASVRTVGGSRTAIYNCLIPVTATIIARVVFHDQLTIVKLVGAVLIVLGILATRRTSR